MSKVEIPTNAIAIPENLEDVNHTWLSSILGISISPSNFLATPNAQVGTGFLSQIVRVSCEELDGTPLKLIVKLLPQGDSSNTDFAKTIVVDAAFDVREIDFYSIIYPDLIQVLPELKDYMCHFYTGFITENPRSSVIVMGDLKPDGYKTINFGNYLSEFQMEESVKFMAKFHYASNALEYKKKLPLDQIYPFLHDKNANEPTKQSFFTFFINGLAKLDAFFEKENCSVEFRDYFKSLLPDQIPIFTNVFRAMNKHTSLIHGDLWSNNLLVQDDGKSIKVIDWQLVACGDPSYDLAVLIISILPPERLKRDEVERLLRLYFDTYLELSDFGIE
ncbi:unnamed protein product [Allacma fusca]|uniref:Protein kinase domain-containing protein n=1 Tax=Allacma fusca TaxID=39272 RepID=A0A8J2LSW0_9HEXA|nr:unnamed protein product [Allacma fusca]